MGEAVAARPKRALRTRVAGRIVHTFFVGTAYDAIHPGHGADPMLAQKYLDLFANCVVVADVAILREPALKQTGLVPFVGKNRDRYLVCYGGGWTVQGDGGERITSKSTLGFFGHPGCWASDLPHWLMQYLFAGSVKRHKQQLYPLPR